MSAKPIAVPLEPGRTGFVRLEYRDPRGRERVAALYLPTNYFVSDEQYPLIVFLHGAGECGTDGQHPIQVGLGPEIARRDFPFVVLFPQAAEILDLGRFQEDNSAEILDAVPHIHMQNFPHLLDQVLRDYRIDPTRIHLTGLSMGGAGALTLAAHDPQRWATLSMVCGFGDATLSQRLGHLPVWGFCGDADSEWLLESMRAIMAGFRAVCHDFRYDEYPGVGHHSWERAYATDELYTWMLRHRRPS